MIDRVVQNRSEQLRTILDQKLRQTSGDVEDLVGSLKGNLYSLREQGLDRLKQQVSPAEAECLEQALKNDVPLELLRALQAIQDNSGNSGPIRDLARQLIDTPVQRSFRGIDFLARDIPLRELLNAANQAEAEETVRQLPGFSDLKPELQERLFKVLQEAGVIKDIASPRLDYGYKLSVLLREGKVDEDWIRNLEFAVGRSSQHEGGGKVTSQIAYSFKVELRNTFQGRVDPENEQLERLVEEKRLSFVVGRQIQTFLQSIEDRVEREFLMKKLSETLELGASETDLSARFGKVQRQDRANLLKERVEKLKDEIRARTLEQLEKEFPRLEEQQVLAYRKQEYREEYALFLNAIKDMDPKVQLEALNSLGPYTPLGDIKMARERLKLGS